MVRTLVSICLIGLISWFGQFQLAGTCFGFQDLEDSQKLSLKREDDSKLIGGLRARRLFDLAEIYCQQLLSQPNVDPTSQANLTIELIKTQTSKAILSPVSERSVAWQQVTKTANEFLKNNPEHPRSFLVEVQLALSHITQGKLIRQEIAAEMATETARQEALKQLRIARSQLEKLEREIENAIPNQRGRSLTEHDLSVSQLLNLKNSLRYQLAISDLTKSQLYDPSDRLNRINALDSVKERLAEVQRATSPGRPLWWKTTLGQLECFRLLGDFQTAKNILDALPEDTPSTVQMFLVEQKIRLAIAVGDEDFAKQTILEFSEIATPTAPLDLALIELAVDLSARVSTDDGKKRWLNFASGEARAMEAKHGGYWARRADLILIQAAGGRPNAVVGQNSGSGSIAMSPTTGQTNSIVNTELDQLIRLGEDAFRKNNFEDAIKAYDAAASKARALGDSAQALRLDMVVGQILESQSEFLLAANRFIKSSLNDTTVEYASSSHLRGCWNLSKTFEQTPDNARLFDEQLGEHLQTWPDSPSANQARLYLAGRLQNKQEWRDAFETYLAIATDSPHLDAGLAGAAWTGKKLLSSISLKQAPTLESKTREIVAALEQKQATLQADDPVGMQFGLLAAELSLVYDSSTSFVDSAKRLLPMQSSSDSRVANSSRAIGVAYLANSDPATSKQWLNQISDDLQALQLCERCLKAASVRQPTTAVHEIRLSAIELLLAKTPAGEKDKDALLLINKSEVLLALEQYDKASKILRDLEAKFPRNAGIKMQLARSLTFQYQKSDPSKPLNQWRRLVRQLKSYTPNWYEAKYNVAKLLVESGKSLEAVKVLKLLKEIGPGWDDSSLKTEFEQLLKSASQGL